MSTLCDPITYVHTEYTDPITYVHTECTDPITYVHTECTSLWLTLAWRWFCKNRNIKPRNWCII